MKKVFLGFIVNILFLYAYKALGSYFIPDIHGTYDISGILMTMSIKAAYVLKYNDGDLRKCLMYLLYTPGLTTGPVIPYSTFIAKNKRTLFSLNFLNSFFVSLTSLFIYSKYKNYPFLEKIKSEDSFFIEKLIYLYFYNLVNRCKFHFAWRFSHCCFCLFGHSNFLNIKLKEVEMAISTKEICANWNIFVSVFLKEF